MNKKLIPVLMVVIFLVTSNFSLPQAYADGTTIQVKPPKIVFDPAVNATVGKCFNITIWVNNVTDLASFQIRIWFNHTFINVTQWFEPTWNSSYVFYNKTTLPTPLHYKLDMDLNLSRAQFGSALFLPPPTQEAFNGTGLMAIVEFNITAVPTDGQIFSCSLDIDNVDTFLLDSNGDEIPDVTKESGEVVIVPEFSLLLALLIFMCITAAVVVLSKKFVGKPRVPTIPVGT